MSQPNLLNVTLTTLAPANTAVAERFALALPKNASGTDDVLLISDANSSETFSARVEELASGVSGILDLRMQMFAERIIGRLLEKLKVGAKQSASRW